MASRPESKPAFKFAVIAAGIVLVAVVGGAGFYAYQTFFPPPEPAPPARSSAPPAPVAEPGPASSTPGKMIEKARAAAAARAQVNEEQLGPVLEADRPSAPATAPAAPVPAAPEVAPPPEVAAPARMEPVSPSDEFKQWVARVRVNGVRGGADARAHINDRLVRKGEVVDHALGITFEGVDPEQNVLVFKDREGAVVGKRF